MNPKLNTVYIQYIWMFSTKLISEVLMTQQTPSRDFEYAIHFDIHTSLYPVGISLNYILSICLCNYKIH